MLRKKLDKIDLQADIESIRLLLENEKYKGYCEYLSPISPIYNSKSLSIHYKFVHSFSKYRIVLQQRLALRSMEKASSGSSETDGFKQNPPLNLELLHTHFQLKKEILDDLTSNIPKLPVSHFTIKWAIHKSLLKRYVTPLTWLLGFVGIM